MRLLLSSVLLSGAVIAQAPDRFRPIDGPEFRGVLREMDADRHVHIGLPDGATRVLALDLLQEIQLGAVARVESSDQPDTLWLRSGLVLPAVFDPKQPVRRESGVAAASYRLPFTSELLEIQWRHVRAVRFRSDGQAPAGFVERALDPPEDVDLLYANREDGETVRVSVRFLDVSDDHVRVRFGGAEQSMPLSRVQGLVFGKNRGAPPDRQEYPRVHLSLRSGRELSGSLEALDAARCQLRIDENQLIDLPRALVAQIAVESRRLVRLTDLAAKMEQTAALDRVWPPIVDQGPEGGAIRLGGRTYSRGLVLFPHTVMTYSLGGRFDLLETTIGLEDNAGAHANAVFRIRADDRLLFDSGSVTPQAEPQLLKLPVTGVQKLSLEVDFGENLDLGDVCVFADPRLLVR